jgi:hypothetical protein
MEGTRYPSPSDRIVKVGRGFEWSRLESELMTSAYEHVVPIGRSTPLRTLLTGHERGANQFIRFDDERHYCVIGA